MGLLLLISSFPFCTAGMDGGKSLFGDAKFALLCQPDARLPLGRDANSQMQEMPEVAVAPDTKMHWACCEADTLEPPFWYELKAAQSNTLLVIGTSHAREVNDPWLLSARLI